MKTRHQHGLPEREILPLLHVEKRRWARLLAALLEGEPPGPERENPPSRRGLGDFPRDQKHSMDDTTVAGYHRPVNAGVAADEMGDTAGEVAR